MITSMIMRWSIFRNKVLATGGANKRRRGLIILSISGSLLVGQSVVSLASGLKRIPEPRTTGATNANVILVESFDTEEIGEELGDNNTFPASPKTTHTKTRGTVPKSSPKTT
jgi:hypothetical protein